MMEQTTKKPRLTEAPSRADPPKHLLLSTLPRVVVDAIFAFAVDTKAEVSLLPLDSNDIPIRKAFSSVAMVSKEWLEVATQLHSECELRSALVIESAKRSLMLGRRQELTRRRAFVMRIVMETNRYGGNRGSLQFATETLSYVPYLQELDLGRLYCSSEELAAIVALAVCVCPAIHTLVLPSRWTEHYEKLVTAVFGAASEWRKNKSSGLRYLRLPMSGLLKDTESANAYVSDVTTHCPQIEQLDDARTSADEYRIEGGGMDDGDGAALWQVDLGTWTRFCETCSQLTMFNWLGMPFATSFFEAFGRQQKPQLKRLTLGTSTKWNWTNYLSQADPKTVEAISTKGFAATATNLQAVFAACPKLRELTIMSHTRKGSDSTSLLDTAVFSEALGEELVRHCPMLETLTLRQNAFRASDLVALTDHTLQTLASLSGLHSVSLDYVEMSGDGLFDLVVNHAATTRHERVFMIRSGNRPDKKIFYALLEGFLKRLADCDGELPCASRRVRLLLESQNVPVSEAWSAEYFKRVQAIGELARTKYPDLLLKVVVNDYDHELRCFSSIHRFTFVTKPTLEEIRATNQYTYEKIDEVFVSQQWESQSDDEVEEEIEYMDDYGYDSGYDDFGASAPYWF